MLFFERKGKFWGSPAELVTDPGKSSLHKIIAAKNVIVLGPVYMEASQPGKRAGPLSETNVWLVFIWESQPGKRAECFGSNAHARKERAKIAFTF